MWILGALQFFLTYLSIRKLAWKCVVVTESRTIYGEGHYWSDELNSYIYPEGGLEDTMSNGDFEVKYSGCAKRLKLVGTTEDSEIHLVQYTESLSRFRANLFILSAKALGYSQYPSDIRTSMVHGNHWTIRIQESYQFSQPRSNTG